MPLTPTPEQQAIIDAYRAGTNMVVQARAGTGKTSTLKMLAGAQPDRSGIYIAYNKAIASDAARSFPRNVECRTAHSLAYRAIGKDYKDRLNGPRQPARVIAQLLRISPVRIDASLLLSATQVARIVADTVAGFCRSADPEITWRHVPFIEGIVDPAARSRLRTAVIPLAQRAWKDLTSKDGKLKFSHDHYLKLWQLSGPKLDVDVVMLDEAQDANPLIADIVERQTHAQRIMVGDQSQAIYGWNGAVDAMSKFEPDAPRLYLSESFRFGPAIAAEANKWLGILGADPKLTGRAQHASTLRELHRPNAVLCRTNAGAVGELMAAAEDGKRAALVGGGDAIKRLAEAALDLQAGRPTSHPELMAFASWGMVREYVEQEQAGADLKVFVNLIDNHGAHEVIRIMDRLVDERYADVVISTAHKAKGREWDSVKVAGDFRAPKAEKDETVRDDEAMLAYVTVTRARKILDRGGLAWVDIWVPGAQQAATEPVKPAETLEGIEALHRAEIEQHQANLAETRRQNERLGIEHLHPVGQQQLAIPGQQLHLGQEPEPAGRPVTRGEPESTAEPEHICRNCGEPIVFGPWESWHHAELVDCEGPEPAGDMEGDPLSDETGQAPVSTSTPPGWDAPLDELIAFHLREWNPNYPQEATRTDPETSHAIRRERLTMRSPSQ